MTDLRDDAKRLMPSDHDLAWATILALRAAGVGLRYSDAVSLALKQLDLSPDVLAIKHTNGKCGKVEYRAKWTLTHLKNAGLLTLMEKRWRLSDAGMIVDRSGVQQALRGLNRRGASQATRKNIVRSRTRAAIIEESHRDRLISAVGSAAGSAEALSQIIAVEMAVGAAPHWAPQWMTSLRQARQQLKVTIDRIKEAYAIYEQNAVGETTGGAVQGPSRGTEADRTCGGGAHSEES